MPNPEARARPTRPGLGPGLAIGNQTSVWSEVRQAYDYWQDQPGFPNPELQSFNVQSFEVPSLELWSVGSKLQTEAAELVSLFQDFCAPFSPKESGDEAVTSW